VTPRKRLSRVADQVTGLTGKHPERILRAQKNVMVCETTQSPALAKQRGERVRLYATDLTRDIRRYALTVLGAAL